MFSQICADEIAEFRRCKLYFSKIKGRIKSLVDAEQKDRLKIRVD